MSTKNNTYETVSFPTIADLPDRDYKTILADPPWQYDDDSPHPGAADHYETLPVDVIRGLGPYVNQVAASHAHLYLWTTNSFLQAACQVADSWGFDVVTNISWIKVLDAPDTLPHEREDPVEIESQLGLGHYYRNTTEHLLFCRKGRKQTERNDVVSHFFAERSEHSAKPVKSYRLIEEMSDGPRLELFARGQREDWDVWGNEV